MQVSELQSENVVTVFHPELSNMYQHLLRILHMLDNLSLLLLS